MQRGLMGRQRAGCDSLYEIRAARFELGLRSQANAGWLAQCGFRSCLREDAGQVGEGERRAPFPPPRLRAIASAPRAV